MTETTAELSRFAAYFPADLALAGLAGALIMCSLVFRKRLNVAADPTTPVSTSAVWLDVLTTLVIGVLMAVVFGGLVVDYLNVEKPPYRIGLAGGIGFFGVGIAELAQTTGLFGVWKIVAGKKVP